MSEPKMISPMLDGFVMGATLSQHDGVCCCPAMKENSDNKYIVKIISIPSSQRQLDALLLTGAYPDAAGAMEYFKEVADGVVEEAKLLRKLSKLEGFLSYEDWQVVPMEGNDLGYQVYLISPYRLSLEKYMRRNLMTHLNAVNLGLDLCAAASICRNAGYMMVDTKPSNIFISEDKEYRVGDLGFVPMDSLKFSSMPGKYISRYTAPEVLDPMATVNETVDVYAIGLVLYQIYNNGELPFGGNAVAEEFPSPVNADYEMAEILAKACAPDPENRWSSPMEMGQALVDYMQRNTVNDTPIAPPSVRIAPKDEAAAAEPAPQEQGEQEGSDELAFMQDMTSDETAPGEEDAESAEPVTEEVTSMLALADDLISHETPEPISSQETIRVPVGAIPSAAPVTTTQETIRVPVEETLQPVVEEDEEDEDTPFSEFFDEDDYDEDDYDEEDFEEDPVAVQHINRVKKKTWLTFLLIGLLVALLCFGGFFFYRNFYVQSIESLTVDPHHSQVTVYLKTEIDESLLTVSCTDSYGNSMTLPVKNHQVVFTELKPNTHYRVVAEISGFHKLEGSTSVSFTSDEETRIVNFTAVTGPQDGSVVLDFSVEGLDSQDWIVTYYAEGEEPRTQSFTGHMVTINDLTISKSYTFTLSGAGDLFMAGEYTLEFTAASIVLAKDLKIAEISGDALIAQWTAPEGISVESWTVRCYSESGYDLSQTVTETTASFSGLTAGDTYTVEVTAAGMTQPVRTTLTASPITITSLQVDDSQEGKLLVTWEYTGEAPEGGWLLMYTLDNGQTQSVVSSQEPSAEISPRIPGAVYHLTVNTGASVSVFNAEHSYTSPDAPVFSDHATVIARWNFDLCRTPTKENWTPGNVKQQDYVTAFKSSEKISFVMTSSGHYIPKKDMQIMYVIRDAEGNALPELVATETLSWYQMWVKTYPKTALTLPKQPTVPGSYKLYLYFNGAAAAVMDFTITE